MGRTRRRAQLAVSLLPFLSVLACVIGTLTLLLAAVAVGGMGGAPLEEVHRAERFEALQTRLVAGKSELELLEAQLSAREEALAADAELGRRLAGLGLEVDVSLEELDGLLELLERERVLDARRAAIDAKARRLAAAKQAKQAEIKDRDALQARAPIIIDPGGLGRTQRPYLVECRADSIEIHRTKGDWTYRIAVADIAESNDFHRFLRRIQVIQSGIVIFLIRPDGVLTYGEASAVADHYRVRHAKLPLPGEGQLDLSRFSEES